MPQQTTTFLEELASAARGCFALLTGNRQAASFFDFSQRGMLGSAIAFLIASTVMAFVPQMFGFASAPGAATTALLIGAVTFVLQMGVAYIVLRQIGRTDGFIPFFVADNWATFFTSFISMALLMIGGSSDYVFLGIGLVVIVVEINIARLIVTLAPLQIAMFIIAQLAASFAVLLLLSRMLGPVGAPAA